MSKKEKELDPCEQPQTPFREFCLKVSIHLQEKGLKEYERAVLIVAANTGNK